MRTHRVIQGLVLSSRHFQGWLAGWLAAAATTAVATRLANWPGKSGLAGQSGLPVWRRALPKLPNQPDTYIEKKITFLGSS